MFIGYTRSVFRIVYGRRCRWQYADGVLLWDCGRSTRGGCLVDGRVMGVGRADRYATFVVVASLPISRSSQNSNLYFSIHQAASSKLLLCEAGRADCIIMQRQRNGCGGVAGVESCTSLVVSTGTQVGQDTTTLSIPSAGVCSRSVDIRTYTYVLHVGSRRLLTDTLACVLACCV